MVESLQTPIAPRPGPAWNPVPHTVLKDSALAETLHTKGFAVVPFLDEAQLKQLQEVYKTEHEIPNQEGGMFYSVYSQDLAYRKRIHDTIAEIMAPSFDRYFTSFKNPVNFFVSKLPGPASEFSIHQDMTAVDERKYSPVSVWTPLVDITEENGALCMMPKSHWFFSPYRGISFPFPFGGILSTVREYLIPVTLKAGETVIFDPRVLHNSLPNQSQADRPAIVSGIFPPDAEMISCYREPGEGNAIELLAHPDDWLLKYENFLHNCHIRPPEGKVVGHADFEFPAMDEKTFVGLCEMNGIQPANAIPALSDQHCNMIGEPIGTQESIQGARPDGNGDSAEPAARPGIFQKLKSVFNR